jgi:uncharacterized protein YndB with AHSA1/START domain
MELDHRNLYSTSFLVESDIARRPAVKRSAEQWMAERRALWERRLDRLGEYLAAAGRVFAAFASREAKAAWGGTGSPEPAPGEAVASEFDFRVGGRERYGNVCQGVNYRFAARYYDIVPDQRIVYAYEMYAGDARISVSVATVEFAKAAEGTRLTLTEQGVYLDGLDAPAPRRGGTEAMPDGLAGHLRDRAG